MRKVFTCHSSTLKISSFFFTFIASKNRYIFFNAGPLKYSACAVVWLYRNDKEANKYVASTANKVSSGVYGGTMPSDIRLKTNITKVGETEYGISLYEFNYKDMLGLDHINRYKGVMAQDLLKTNMSEAVLLNSNGYYSINYNQLNINLEKL